MSWSEPWHDFRLRRSEDIRKQQTSGKLPNKRMIFDYDRLFRLEIKSLVNVYVVCQVIRKTNWRLPLRNLIAVKRRFVSFHFVVLLLRFYLPMKKNETMAVQNVSCAASNTICAGNLKFWWRKWYFQSSRLFSFHSPSKLDDAYLSVFVIRRVYICVSMIWCVCVCFSVGTENRDWMTSKT